MKENVLITEPIEMVDPNWMQKTGGYARDMTLHDWYAGLAMQGLTANGADSSEADSGWNWFAGEAYSMADAMLRAREAK